MLSLFTKHPKSIGESYFEHLYFAAKFGLSMLLGGFACLIHAIFPFLFVKTGSNFLLKMTQNFIDRAPVIEPRVQVLADTITRKTQQNQ